MSHTENTPPSGDPVWIHVQLGRILGGLEEVQKDTGEMRAAQSAMRQEVSGLTGKIDGINDKMEVHAERLEKIEKPVEQFVTMRNNAAGGLLVFTAFGAVATYFREWIIAHLFGRPLIP